MRRNLLIGLAVLAVLVVAVSAVSTVKRSDPVQSPQVAVNAPGGTGSRAGSGEPGSMIATFTAEDVDGRPVEVRPGKPGALFFFAGWCGSCLAEAEALDRVQRELDGRVTVTAISPDPSDSVEAIRLFRRNVGSPGYPFIWDSRGALGSQFAVRALDTTIVYDAKGKVVFRDAAISDAATLKAAFRKAGA